MSIPTLAEAQRLLRAKKISSVELTKACLKRIDQHEGKVNAFIRLTEKDAMASARAADKAIAAGTGGPLAGVPVAYKDIYETAGIPTTAHSRILQDHVPKEDAETVRRMAAAGAVSLGKLATHEFAIGGPAFDLPWPPAKNPWDTARFTGGSSSGSAAGLAAGFFLGTLGSDTGGSIRNPAAFCGVAGIKPTAGLLSRRGVVPLSQSLDTAGPMAWTAEDCAILLDILAGHDPRDPASVAAPPPAALKAVRAGMPKGLRIGYARRWHERDMNVAREQHSTMASAVRLLEGLGARVEECDPGALIDYTAVNRLVIVAEAYAIHEHTLITRPDDHSRAFRLRVLGGAAMRAADYLAAQRQRGVLANKLNAMFADYDLILTAAVAGPARTLEEEKTDLPRFLDKAALASPANISGGPASAVCTAFTEAGLPLAVQLIGAPFNDALVLAVSSALETAAGTRGRRPSLLG